MSFWNTKDFEIQKYLQETRETMFSLTGRCGGRSQKHGGGEIEGPKHQTEGVEENYRRGPGPRRTVEPSS